MKKYLLLFMVTSVAFPINAQVESWDPDWDGDNNVGVSDLLGLLSVFGDYDLDNDGIWDSVDDCVGEYDECGVCNGEGIPDGYNSCDEFYGACGGATFLSYHGFDYSVVQIGDQCWFADNLRSLLYANHAPIEDENVFSCSEDSPESTDTGFLYTWWAVDSPNGLCPNGWHVPSYEDWQELQFYVGYPHGTPLKNSQEDYPSWNGTNVYGFSAFAQGRRAFDDEDCTTPGFAWFWSSTPLDGNIIRSVYLNESPVLYHEINFWAYGHNIRCLKDSE